MKLLVYERNLIKFNFFYGSISRGTCKNSLAIPQLRAKRSNKDKNLSNHDKCKLLNLQRRKENQDTKRFNIYFQKKNQQRKRIFLQKQTKRSCLVMEHNLNSIWILWGYSRSRLDSLDINTFARPVRNFCLNYSTRTEVAHSTFMETI